MKRTSFPKRLLSLALTVIMTAGLFAVPAFGDEVKQDVPDFQKVNIIINNERGLSDVEIDALIEEIKAALKEKGIGTRSLNIVMNGIDGRENVVEGVIKIKNKAPKPDKIIGGGGGDGPKELKIDLEFDFTKWIVADHYDIGFWQPGTTFAAVGNLESARYNPAANTNTTAAFPAAWGAGNSGAVWQRQFGSGAAFNVANTNLRPYFPNSQRNSGTGLHAGGNYTGIGGPGSTSGIWGNNTAALPRMTLENWLVNTPRGGNANQQGHAAPVAILAALDRHINLDLSGKPRMDFVGYSHSRFVDFAFYPVDTDAELAAWPVYEDDAIIGVDDPVGEVDLRRANKLVSFEVDGTRVNAHTLFGAGFLVNAGYYMSGGNLCISGYYLAYTYPDIGYGAFDPGLIPPTALVLYRIAPNTTVQNFHQHMLGSTANNIDSAPRMQANTGRGTTANGTGDAPNLPNYNAAIFEEVAMYDLRTYRGANNTAITMSNYFRSTHNNNGTSVETNPSQTSAARIARTYNAANAGNVWYPNMLVNLVIESVENNVTKLTVYQENKGTNIEYWSLDDIAGDTPTKAELDRLGYPKNITPLTSFYLPNTGDNAGRSFNGFGPAVSYRSHACNRATLFTFSEMEMDIIGAIDLGGQTPETYTVSYAALPGQTVTRLPSAQTKTQWSTLSLTLVCGFGVYCTDNHGNLICGNSCGLPLPPRRVVDNVDWTFYGWSLTPDGATYDYDPGEDFDGVLAADGESELANNVVLYALFEDPTTEVEIDAPDHLIGFLKHPSTQALLLPGHVNYIIDLVDHDNDDYGSKRYDRLNSTPNANDQYYTLFKEALNYMKEWGMTDEYGEPGIINYITDMPNSLLTDGADGILRAYRSDSPEAMLAPDLGRTFLGMTTIEKWRKIAEYIASKIPPCRNGINYYGDEILVFGFQDLFIVDECAECDEDLDKCVCKCSDCDELLGECKCVDEFICSICGDDYDDCDCDDKVKVTVSEKKSARKVTGETIPATKRIADHRAALIATKDEGLDADTDHWLNLTDETITFAKGYEPAAFSVDGGKKWRAIKNVDKVFGQKGMAKMLNRGLELHVSDVWIARNEKNTDKDAVKAGAPKVLQARGVPDGKGTAEAANVLKFDVINNGGKRPKVGKFVINYRLYADMTGKSAGGWGISTKEHVDKNKTIADVLKNNSHGFRAAALIDGWQIAAGPKGDAKAKLPDAQGYGTFCKGIICARDQKSCHLGNKVGGIPVVELPEGETKAIRSVYFVRMAPQLNIGQSSVTYIPASRAKRVNAVSELRPTRYKPRLVREKTKFDKKTDTTTITKPADAFLKLKRGDNIFAGSIAGLSGESVVMRKNAELVKTGAPIRAWELLEITGPKGAVISTFAMTESDVIVVWKSPTGKRPATQKQVLDNEKPE